MMKYADTIRTLIVDKESEIARLEAELAAARAYVGLLERRLDAAERTLDDVEESADPVVVVRRMILEARQPLFIDEILRGLGRRVTREERDELRRLLLPWVRRKEIFTRPRPLTFGLIELDEGE